MEYDYYLENMVDDINRWCCRHEHELPKFNSQEEFSDYLMEMIRGNENLVRDAIRVCIAEGLYKAIRMGY